MNEPKSPFVTNLELQITIRRIADFFEALIELGEPDKGILLQEISRQMREHMPDAPVNPVAAPRRFSPQSFADRCSELAESAPNDRVQSILRKIALVFEVEAGVDAANSTDIPDAA
jgi:hypothetical protein